MTQTRQKWRDLENTYTQCWWRRMFEDERPQMLAKEDAKRLREQLAADIRICRRPRRRPVHRHRATISGHRRHGFAGGERRAAHRPIRTEPVSTVWRAVSSCCRGPISGKLRRSNETPRTPALGELKDYTGFLVNRSLTLPVTPLNEPQALFDDFW